MDQLEKIDDKEDSLIIALEDLKLLEKKTKDNKQIFAALEKLTKRFYNSTKYKDNEQFIKRWIQYADLCNDSEEVLLFMKENQIGTNLAIFYEVLAIIFEKKRDFVSTNKFILEGIQKKAKPYDKMEKILHGFEERMLTRIDRDFYSKGLTLKEGNHNDFFKKDIFSNDPPKNLQKRKVCDYYTEEIDQISLKRMKAIEEKARETVKIGEIPIFVDEQFRQNINISTQLVDDYAELCKKHNFSKDAPIPKFITEQKLISWISRENIVYKSLEFNSKKKENSIKNIVFIEKPMPKISEEGSSVNSSTALASRKKLKLKEKENIKENQLSTKKFEIDKNCKSTKEKQEFFKNFTEKIEQNILNFFVLPTIKSHDSNKKLQAKQKFMDNFNTSQKINRNNHVFEEISPIPVNVKLAFDDGNFDSNPKKQIDSIESEIDESFDEKISNFFSNEKDKLIIFSSPLTIEKMRGLSNAISLTSPQRNTHLNLLNDQAFILSSDKDSSQSNEEIENFLKIFDEKENVGKKSNKQKKARQALKELPLEEKISLSFSKTNQEMKQEQKIDTHEFHLDDDDFEDFFRKKILNYEN